MSNQNDKWKEYVNQLEGDTKAAAVTELDNLLAFARADSVEFVREQGLRLEKYLLQLANGDITELEFKGYMVDLRDLAEMEAIKAGVAAQASAQRFLQGLVTIVFGMLIKLLNNAIMAEKAPPQA